MQLSSIRKSTIGKSVLVDSSAIIQVYPSEYTQIWKSIFKTGFLLNNCRGIISPNKNVVFLKKIVKGKLHYLEMKKQMMEARNVPKKLQVLPSIHLDSNSSNLSKNKQNEKNYYFYDLSILKMGIENIKDKYPERRLITIFFQHLIDNYNNLKNENPNKQVYLVLQIDDISNFTFQILKNIRQYKTFLKDQLSQRFFDNFLFVSINNIILPVAEYDEKNNFVPIIQNINKIDKILENNEIVNNINDIDAIQNIDTNNDVDEILPTGNSLAGKIVDVLKDPFSFDVINQKRKNFIQDGQNMKPDAAPKVKPLTLKASTKDDDIKIELDGKTLTKVMKYFKITNPDIIANTKAAIDTYIKDTGEIPTKANAEKLVLKAVNRSIHGTDEIDEKYLAKPALLFNKLKDIDVFSVPLELPKDQNTFPFDISDIVTLKSTNGQFRQKYEFTESIHENIEKVFKTLETQATHPIKVNSITYDFVDTDSDRYTEYTISLTNMDGNKQTYQIKLDIPMIVNDKYFKLGGNKYIFSNQQHLKPLTKTEKNDCRFLTNYAIIRMTVENLKFNCSDINDILLYIQQRYPNLIIEANDIFIKFNDGEKIYLVGDNVYDGLASNVIYEEGKLVDKNNEINFKNNNRFEFLYDIILRKVQSVNPEDSLTKSKKSIPYIAIYLSGIKIPFIIFMWQQKGLLTTLNQFGINYEIVDETPATGDIFLQLENNKFLAIYPSSIRERLIVNGLLVNKIKNPISNLDSVDEINQHISDIYG